MDFYISVYIKYNCNWATCSFSSCNKIAAIKHIICQHAELDTVHFVCTLCGFRGLFQNQLIKHVKTYKPPLLLNQQEATYEDEEYFRMASVPHNVTWGYSQETELTNLYRKGGNCRRDKYSGADWSEGRNDNLFGDA